MVAITFPCVCCYVFRHKQLKCPENIF
uniref:Uncharacterized protein n=1 Tax=Anopheles christyi TaxID=43041 RepID=A0A182KI81_9DIPT